MTEAAEAKAPYETPDAVMSMRRFTYGRPLGLGGRTKWRRRLDQTKELCRRLWCKLRYGYVPGSSKDYYQRFVLVITYRDYTQRIHPIHLQEDAILGFVDQLMAAPTVRGVEVGELLLKTSKSFGEDYNPDKAFEYLMKAVGKAEAEVDQ